MEIPETRYAHSGDVSIAYQVVGEGTVDLVFVPGFISNVEMGWEEPRLERFYLSLAAFSRLILFDKRGTGLSDRVKGIPTLEERMDDLRAVMDAVGSERAVIMGISEGGPMTALFAATHPERTIGAILYGCWARRLRAPDYPYGTTLDEFLEDIRDEEERFGTPEYVDEILEWLAPSAAGDEQFRRRFARFMRLSASPGAAAALARMNVEVDVRHVLPAIRVPTLVISRAGDNPEPRRYMAEHIPGARYVELPGRDHAPWVGDAASIVAEIERFLAGIRVDVDLERQLSTVLFTDIVGSTAAAAEAGDARWKELVTAHHALVRGQLARFRGREIDTAGDGFFASFDGPARAIRCACSIRDAVGDLGLQIRAGLHTGECELVDGKVGGIAVNIGARVAAQAGPGEVLASSTVKDLVAGSGIAFRERGIAELKGVPGEWRLFAVESA